MGYWGNEYFENDTAADWLVDVGHNIDTKVIEDGLKGSEPREVGRAAANTVIRILKLQQWAAKQLPTAIKQLQRVREEYLEDGCAELANQIEYEMVTAHKHKANSTQALTDSSSSDHDPLCDSCGEIYMSEEVAEDIKEIAEPLARILVALRR